MKRSEKPAGLAAVATLAAVVVMCCAAASPSCFGATAVRYHVYELPWPDQVYGHEPYVYAMNNAGVVAGFTLSGQPQALRWDPTNPANIAAGYGATLLRTWACGNRAASRTATPTPSTRAAQSPARR